MPQFNVFQLAILELSDSQLKEMDKKNVELYKSRWRRSVRSALRRATRRRVEEHRNKSEVHKVPVVIGENPHEAYRERMKEILQDNTHKPA